MKVVCSFVGGAGHLAPQLPLLRALSEGGHELTLVGRESAMHAAPSHWFTQLRPRADRRRVVSGDIAPLAPVDVANELAVVENHFAGPAAQESFAAVAPLLSGASVLVCDELDFGAMAAADRAGVPVVVVAVIASGALVRDELVDHAVVALRSEYGLVGSPRLRGDLFVVPFAPSMRDPRIAVGPDTAWMRPDGLDALEPDGSIVVTLGTEFNTESGDLFDRILDAVGETDGLVTVAIGRDLDPARFGLQPAHVRVEQFVDLAALMPRASAVLHHGGSGMFTTSILTGTPQVILPMGADQPFTAQRVCALGVGSALDALRATPEDIRTALDRARASRDIRTNTAAVRDELLGLPHADAVAARVVSLGR